MALSPHKIPKFLVTCPQDTAENWAATTYIIPKGILCVDTDSRLAKLGDGLRTWNELAYLGPDPIPNEVLAQLTNLQELNKTFTPSFSGGSHTYTTRIGNYSRVGQLVWVNLELALAAKAANTSGVVLTITGLPYPVSARSTIDVPCIKQVLTLAKNAIVGAKLIAGTNTLKLYSHRIDVGTTTDLTASGALLTNSKVSLSFVYEKA